MTSRTCMATFSFPLLTLKTLSPMVTCCRKTPYLFTISSLIVFFYVLRRASSESLFSIFDLLPQQKTQVDAVLVAITM